MVKYGKIAHALKATKGKHPVAGGTKMAGALANTKKDAIQK